MYWGFNISIDPVPASRPRVARYGTYYAPRYEQYRKNLANIIARLGTTTDIYYSALRLEVTFIMPFPKSYSKKKRSDLDGDYCYTKPDLDNLEKALYDAMNGIIYKDDCQIVEHTVRKIWGEVGMIKVTIIPLQVRATKLVPI